MRKRTVSVLGIASGHSDRPPPKDGPQPGDVCLGCRHRPNPFHGAHWYWVEQIEFQAPGGDRLAAQWVFVCKRCFEQFGRDLQPALETGRAQFNNHLLVLEGMVFQMKGGDCP